MEIIANHAHVFPKEVNESGTLEALERLLDECGIDKAVCFAPFSDYLKTSGENANRWLYEKIKNEARFFGFGTVDFTRDDLEEQVEEIYALGFSGVKVHASHQRVRVDGDKACRVYAVCEKRGLPVSFHTGLHWSRLSEHYIMLYDEVAHRFPELKFSMEHVGGYSFFNEAVAIMCNNRENVFAGLTSVFDSKMNKFWYLGREKVRDLFWLTGIDRSIFGLDFPYNNAEFVREAMSELRACVLDNGWGEDGLEKVFGKNFLKFIGRENG